MLIRNTQNMMVHEPDKIVIHVGLVDKLSEMCYNILESSILLGDVFIQSFGQCIKLCLHVSKQSVYIFLQNVNISWLYRALIQEPDR